MRLHFISTCVLFALVLMFYGVRSQSKTIGYEVRARANTFSDGKGIYIFAEMDKGFTDGNLTGFSAYFKDAAGPFKFQIWRRVDRIEHRMFMLVYQMGVPYDTFGEFHDSLPPRVHVHVEDGDRFGFIYPIDGACPLMATFVNKATNFFRASADSRGDLPSEQDIGERVMFEDLSYPVEFSIAAHYIASTDPEFSTVIVLGESGATGIAGATGATGHTGPGGFAGTIGATGHTGIRGAKGDTGFQGDRGRIGVTGPLGPTGATGLTGETGARGNRGERGNSGPVGEKGDSGMVGSSGPRGRPGATGYTGPSGVFGPRGETGATGATGMSGYTGATGGPGHTGATGPSGIKGTPGPLGATGPPGATGAQGLRGPVYQDVDECLSAEHGCDHHCINEFGAYRCYCDDGYTLLADNKGCKDINECDDHNGGCQKVCTNMLGGFKCSCPPGLVLAENFLHCDDIAECAVNNGGCEDEMCLDTYGSSYCVYSDVPVYEAQELDRVGTDTDSEVLAADELASQLVNREVVIGMIVWLILLSFIILALLLCLCVRKIRESTEANTYLRVLDGRSRAGGHTPTKDPSLYY